MKRILVLAAVVGAIGAGTAASVPAADGAEHIPVGCSSAYHPLAGFWNAVIYTRPTRRPMSRSTQLWMARTSDSVDLEPGSSHRAATWRSPATDTSMTRIPSPTFVFPSSASRASASRFAAEESFRPAAPEPITAKPTRLHPQRERHHHLPRQLHGHPALSHADAVGRGGQGGDSRSSASPSTSAASSRTPRPVVQKVSGGLVRDRRR
jgi:hypothetical protein